MSLDKVIPIASGFTIETDEVKFIAALDEICVHYSGLLTKDYLLNALILFTKATIDKYEENKDSLR
jgi:hypothetical protein